MSSSRIYTRNCEVTADVPMPSGMQRVALGVEYQGASFRGFQAQKHDPQTVQGYLQKALSWVADETITLVCAGRTDAGVHATGQVVHFDTLAVRPNKAWVHGVNARLPDGIAVNWAENVPASFHARFSARNRTYRYLVQNTPARPAILSQQVTWEKKPLSVEHMREAASFLIGEHDFSAFRASQCQARSPVRTMEYINILEQGRFLVVEIQANAFLHHMVRNIMGVLLHIGAGFQSVGWAKAVLDSRDRSQGGVTAPAQGLYLVNVDYPKEFTIPTRLPGPLMLEHPLCG